MPASTRRRSTEQPAGRTSTVSPIRVRTRRGARLPGHASPKNEALKLFIDSQQATDPFASMYQIGDGGHNLMFKPPYNLGSLIRLPRESNMLGQCIAAMVTNTVGHGYFLEYVGPDGKKESGTAQTEKARLEGLLSFPNEDDTLREILERGKADKETLGYGTYEIGRDSTGLITMISHLPAHTIRITGRDEAATAVTVKLPRNGKIEAVTLQKNFRRFVQQINEVKTYFKEMGDPRIIDPATGKVSTELSVENSATEVLYDPVYSPGEIYGVPRWIAQLPSITGSREAELVNLSFFKENAIPAMALLVSGGYLTQDAIEEIENHFTGVRGRESMNRILVLEIEADSRMASQDGALTVPKVDMKGLQGERQEDALFLKYDEGCQGKIRSSFRLPPVFVGGSQDYTYASAKTSFEVAESQIFGPERSSTEDMINNKILSTYKPKYWAFRLETAKISDPQEVIAAVTAFDNAGGMTMNTVISLANEYFGTDMPTIVDEWGDWPFQVVKQLAINGQLKGLDAIADPNQGIPSNAGGAVPGKPPASGGTPKKPKAPAATGTGDKTKDDESSSDMVRIRTRTRKLHRVATDRT